MQVTHPDSSKDYPLVLGETFSEGRTAEYHSLQYKFKPQSAGRQRPGGIQISQGSLLQISLQVPNAVDGMPVLGFEGQWAPAQEGLDCVAIFDGSKWRLELLSGLASNIRHTFTSAAQPSGSAVQYAEPSGAMQPQDTSREASVPLQDDQARMSTTPSVSIPNSSNPSGLAQLSTTPSMSRQVSRETSPSTEGQIPQQPVQELQRQASPSARQLAGEPQAFEAPQPSRGSPSVPPPNSMLEVSTSSASTSSDDEEVVQQPSPSPLQRAQVASSSQPRVEKRPDFEREFFQDNSSSSNDDSMGNASDSSDNESEEEAKHF